jgi:hypothetical protein
MVFMHFNGFSGSSSDGDPIWLAGDRQVHASSSWSLFIDYSDPGLIMAVLTPRLSTPESRIRVLRELVRIKVFTIICFFTIFFLKFWPLQYTLCLLLVVMSFFSTFTVLLVCKMMVVDVVKDNWNMCVNHYLLSVHGSSHSINQDQPSLQSYLEHKRPALPLLIYSFYGS